MLKVRTRIAPSPTGFAHIGTIYQVLFDFCFAKKHDGQFIIRLEDTDRSRLVEGAEQVIYDSIEWFGLTSDEDPIKGGPFAPYKQSERLDIYQKYVDKLLEQKDAYYCFCTKERLDEMRQIQIQKGLAPMYDKFCLSLSGPEVNNNLESGLPKVVRMKIPENENIIVKDELVGEIKFNSNTIDHQVILKSDGYPTYHLAVVVDDYLMKITHIFRGTEWLPSTPKHIILYKYLGWENELPTFVHLPLILNPDGKGKLSKRQQSASVEYYKKEGYLPEAILNYLSNIVWNHPEGKEIYSLEEFTKLFEISDLQAKGARFDLQKLDWMNGEYIRMMGDEELTKRFQEYLVDHPAKDKLGPLVPLTKERIKKLSDFIPLTYFMFQKPEYDKSVFEKIKIVEIQKTLDKILDVLKNLEKPWKKELFEQKLQDVAKEMEIPNRDFFQLIRISFSGQLVTPPLFECMELLGEDETLLRMEYVSHNYQDFPKLEEKLVSE